MMNRGNRIPRSPLRKTYPREKQAGIHLKTDTAGLLKTPRQNIGGEKREEIKRGTVGTASEKLSEKRR